MNVSKTPIGVKKKPSTEWFKQSITLYDSDWNINSKQAKMLIANFYSKK